MCSPVQTCSHIHEGGDEQLYHVAGFLLAQPCFVFNRLDQFQFVHELPPSVIFEGYLFSWFSGIYQGLGFGPSVYGHFNFHI